MSVPSARAALGVVVVNYGSHLLIEENLGRMELPPGSQVVVVDNWSTAAERSAVQRMCQGRGWECVLLEVNGGFGTGMNVGVDKATSLGAEVLLLLNPDAAVQREPLAALVADAVADHQRLTSPKLVRPDDTTWFDGGDLCLTTGTTRGGRHAGEGWLTGACLVLHKDLWRQLGGFDEDYFLYWEDIDLSHRCTRTGGSLSVRLDLVAVHSVGGTQGHDRAKSAGYYYYNCRNRMLFAAKHLPRRLALRWALGAPAHARRVVLRGGRRQLRHPRSNAWPAIRGTLDGIAWWAASTLPHWPRHDRVQ